MTQPFNDPELLAKLQAQGWLSPQANVPSAPQPTPMAHESPMVPADNASLLARTRNLRPDVAPEAGTPTVQGDFVQNPRGGGGQSAVPMPAQKMVPAHATSLVSPETRKMYEGAESMRQSGAQEEAAGQIGANEHQANLLDEQARQMGEDR